MVSRILEAEVNPLWGCWGCENLTYLLFERLMCFKTTPWRETTLSFFSVTCLLCHNAGWRKEKQKRFVDCRKMISSSLLITSKQGMNLRIRKIHLLKMNFLAWLKRTSVTAHNWRGVVTQWLNNSNFNSLSPSSVWQGELPSFSSAFAYLAVWEYVISK